MRKPEFITITEVSKILGWNRWKTSRWLERAGALVRRGAKRVTTKELLKQCFPEVYWSIVEEDFDIDDKFYNEM